MCEKAVYHRMASVGIGLALLCAGCVACALRSSNQRGAIPTTTPTVQASLVRPVEPSAPSPSTTSASSTPPSPTQTPIKIPELGPGPSPTPESPQAQVYLDPGHGGVDT